MDCATLRTFVLPSAQVQTFSDRMEFAPARSKALNTLYWKNIFLQETNRIRKMVWTELPWEPSSSHLRSAQVHTLSDRTDFVALQCTALKFLYFHPEEDEQIERSSGPDTI